jgi:hypothetical protein
MENQNSELEKQWENWVFVVPTKQIENDAQFNKWKNSKAKKIYANFVFELNDAIKGKKLSADCKISQVKLKLN